MASDRAIDPDPSSPRLFVGVPIPASVTSAIDAAIDPWMRRLPRARWVPSQDRHVTMKYLGPTQERIDAWVRDRVRAVAASSLPFELRPAGLDTFPPGRPAHILWVGLEDEGWRLAGVVRMLEVDMAAEFAPERRSFTPHVTVARSEHGLALPAGYRETSVTSPSFAVREIVLYRSHGGRSASRYEPLESFRLGP